MTSEPQLSMDDDVLSDEVKALLKRAAKLHLAYQRLETHHSTFGISEDLPDEFKELLRLINRLLEGFERKLHRHKYVPCMVEIPETAARDLILIWDGHTLQFQKPHSLEPPAPVVRSHRRIRAAVLHNLPTLWAKLIETRRSGTYPAQIGAPRTVRVRVDLVLRIDLDPDETLQDGFEVISDTLTDAFGERVERVNPSLCTD